MSFFLRTYSSFPLPIFAKKQQKPQKYVSSRTSNRFLPIRHPSHEREQVCTSSKIFSCLPLLLRVRRHGHLPRHRIPIRHRLHVQVLRLQGKAHKRRALFATQAISTLKRPRLEKKGQPHLRRNHRRRTRRTKQPLRPITPLRAHPTIRTTLIPQTISAQKIPKISIPPQTPPQIHLPSKT